MQRRVLRSRGAKCLPCLRMGRHAGFVSSEKVSRGGLQLYDARRYVITVYIAEDVNRSLDLCAAEMYFVFQAREFCVCVLKILF